MKLDVIVLDLRFRAEDVIEFPPGRAANILRGTLGKALYGAAWYERFFAPRRADGPSGWKDPPRPFVLRVSHLDGARIEPGRLFSVRLNVFLAEACDFLVRAVERAGLEGWGPGRGKARLVRHVRTPVEVSLAPAGREVSRVRVRFLTPTELKIDGGLAAQPDFGILFARLRDRVSTLRAVYGAGPLDLEFASLGDRASRVRMVSCNVRQEFRRRHSSHTGQTHPLAGFTGEAAYEGSLSEFMPFLHAGYWTGVGRQTVWGHGQMEAFEEAPVTS